jgi:hypothetical protein
MSVVWYEKNPGATEAEIRAFEEKEQLILPESYKAFLREMDGGRPMRNHNVSYVDERLGRTWMSVKDFFGIRESIFTEPPPYLDQDLSPEVAEARAVLAETMKAVRAEAEARFGKIEPQPMSLSIVRRNLMRALPDEEYFPRDMLMVVDTLTGHDGITLRLGTEEVYAWFDDQAPVLLAPTFTDFLEQIRFNVSDEEFQFKDL